MQRKRYSDEQVAFALRRAESGTAVEEICRKMAVSEARRLTLEEEVRRDGRRRDPAPEAA